jgi:hypothetical protein
VSAAIPGARVPTYRFAHAGYGACEPRHGMPRASLLPDLSAAVRPVSAACLILTSRCFAIGNSDARMEIANESSGPVLGSLSFGLQRTPGCFKRQRRAQA